MLEQFKGSQDANGYGASTTGGLFRASLIETLFDGAHERRPGKGVRPLPDGMHGGHKISDLQAGTSTAQPMLEIMHQAHRWLSCCQGK